MNQQVVKYLSDRPVWSQEGPWHHDNTGYLDDAWEGHGQSLRHACPLETRPQWWACILAKWLKHSGNPSWEVFLPPRKSPSPPDPSDFSFALKHSALFSPSFIYEPSQCCLPFFFFFFLSLVIYWPNHETRGILVPRPGIKPVPPTVEVRSLNHCSTREVPLPFLTPSPRLPSGLLQASFKCLKLLRVS